MRDHKKLAIALLCLRGQAEIESVELQDSFATTL